MTHSGLPMDFNTWMNTHAGPGHHHRQEARNGRHVIACACGSTITAQTMGPWLRPSAALWLVGAALIVTGLVVPALMWLIRLVM